MEFLGKTTVSYCTKPLYRSNEFSLCNPTVNFYVAFYCIESYGAESNRINSMQSYCTQNYLDFAAFEKSDPYILIC